MKILSIIDKLFSKLNDNVNYIDANELVSMLSNINGFDAQDLLDEVQEHIKVKELN